MNIVMAHCYYQQRGGEDAVFEAERDLLRENGYQVRELTFHNDVIASPLAALTAGARAFYNPQAARALARLIAAERPDALHVHNSFPLGSPALFLEARRHGVPVVATLHNYRLICPKAQLFRDGRPCHDCVKTPFALSGVWHGCYRGSRAQTAAVAAMTTWRRLTKTWQTSVNAYIALTDFAKSLLLESSLGLTPDQIVVKPNFCADPGEPAPAPAREAFFLYVGRLSPEKGVETMLRAFEANGLPLRVVGDGPLASRVQQAAAHAENIQYDGFLAPAEVRGLMQRARALIFPSEWPEGFPLTLVEALACGLPAIVSKIGGLPEIAGDGREGLLIPPGDADAITAAAGRLNDDQGLREALSAAARQKYRDCYTPEVTYDALRRLYSRLRDERRVQLAHASAQAPPARR